MTLDAKKLYGCPECGLTFTLTGLCALTVGLDGPFDCPRCKAHFTFEEFMDEQRLKWGQGAPEYLLQNEI